MITALQTVLDLACELAAEEAAVAASFCRASQLVAMSELTGVFADAQRRGSCRSSSAGTGGSR